jgi:glycosyltransferase involved in cell wall biosynthesis/SAM-dependent methyltransferase
MAPIDAWAAGAENVYAHRKRLRFVARAVESHRRARGCRPEEVTVLDVGCGTGVMLTLPLASLGYRVTGVDLHADSIAAASALNPYPHAAFLCGAPEALLERETRYDAVVASEVLEHTADPLAFLRSLRGLLRPGGILVLTTPNGYGWFEGEAFLWERCGVGRCLEGMRAGWWALRGRVKGILVRHLGWRPRSAPPPPAWAGVASTANDASPHLQRFRWGRLRSLLAVAQLAIVDSGNSSLFAGRITHFFLGGCASFVALNARLADALPRALAAGWHLACRVDPALPRTLCLADSGMMSQAVARAADATGTPPTLALSFRQLRQAPRQALMLPLRRFDAAFAYVGDVNHLYRDAVLVYLWLLRADRKALRDLKGNEVTADAGAGLRALGHCLADLARAPVLYGRSRWTVRRLLRPRPARRGRGAESGRVAYLRANLWQESAAGGSVAHTAGVLGGFAAAGLQVTYLGTAEFPPARRLGARLVTVPPQGLRLRNLPDFPFVAYSRHFARRCLAALAGEPPAFVYQRYSLLNTSGAEIARRLDRPFILEYNGSEIWVARNWSTPLMLEGLASRIERANLAAADLVVVVSRPLRDQVVDRGIPPERVLVNPNGVDPDVYHPAVDGGPVRSRLGLEGKLIVGFIGTFGPWHGAEILAHAVKEIAARCPAIHVLFLGDGSGMPRVRAILAEAGVLDRVTLTGLVPQDEAPGYLAACDILASPHVPNPDGSPFFGSPTKLFEYMAMGRGIVASDLEQIGELLAHERTAWLVPPGDPAALAAGILRLAEEPGLRQRLGAAARREAVAHHTWRAHVARMLRRMAELDLLPGDGIGGHGSA